MPPFSLSDWLDPAYLFDLNPGPPPDSYSILSAVFGLVIATCTWGYYLWAKNRFAHDPFRRKLARTIAISFGLVSLIGMLHIQGRIMGIPILSARFVLVLTIIAFLGLIVDFGYYFWRKYPKQAAEADRGSGRQRYLPQQRPPHLPATTRRRKKGKKKR